MLKFAMSTLKIVKKPSKNLLKITSNFSELPYFSKSYIPIFTSDFEIEKRQ